jgi:predicted PurR-regulated permease PerM
LEKSAAGWLARRTAAAAASTRVFGATTTPWIERRLSRRLAVEAVVAWSIAIVIVCGIVAVGVFLVAPVKHTLALLEVIGNVVYSFLSRLEAMSAEPAFAREFCFGVHCAGLIEILGVHLGVNVSEMLDEVVLSEAWPHNFDPLSCTKAADP